MVAVRFFCNSNKQQFIIEEGANTEDIHDMDIIVKLSSYVFAFVWLDVVHNEILYVAFGAKSVISIQNP